MEFSVKVWGCYFVTLFVTLLLEKRKELPTWSKDELKLSEYIMVELNEIFCHRDSLLMTYLIIKQKEKQVYCCRES